MTLRMTFKTWIFRGVSKEDFEGDLEGDLEVDLERDSKEDPTLNRTWQGTCCQGQVQVWSRSGLVLVWFSLQLNCGTKVDAAVRHFENFWQFYDLVQVLLCAD